MMFASKTPRDLNHDPHPWREPDGSRVATWAETRINGGARRVPRPEFDHVQHNPVNPVLTSLRGRLKFQQDVHHPSTAPRIAKTMLSALDKRFPGLEYATIGEIAHARAVLARLASLAEKEQA